MAVKCIIFLCLVAAALGVPANFECETIEKQNFNTNECTLETTTVDVTESFGRCPQDMLAPGPRECIDIEVESCHTFRGVERCMTRFSPHCVDTTMVTTFYGRPSPGDDTCETEQATCHATTVEGPKKKKCTS